MDDPFNCKGLAEAEMVIVIQLFGFYSHVSPIIFHSLADQEMSIPHYSLPASVRITS
jgi:hypothetical protein